jgi:hypothetical protein
LSSVAEEVERTESKLLHIVRKEPRVLKLISSFLGKNDKQSLMFSITEESSQTIDKDDNVLELSSMYVSLPLTI